MSNKVILLAEDNPDDALLTTYALKESNLCNKIVHVQDGVEALDYLFKRGPYAGDNPDELPTLILLDINMPKVGGLEVLKQIRAEPHTRRLPVVMLTTSKEEQDLITSYDLGANSYVRKPVDFDQFTTAARNLGMYWLLLNELAP
ncbi:MAG: response regulator [Candidatus Competibacteraceae bacterium]|nr:MAG: response regulator [Candidatus Competibacteraceae bacterium]